MNLVLLLASEILMKLAKYTHTSTPAIILNGYFIHFRSAIASL